MSTAIISTQTPPQPTQRPDFSPWRVLRQSGVALLFIGLVAIYSATHPASYQTYTPAAAPVTPAATQTTFLDSR